MVKEQIITIFNENKKRYGYRRITQELHNNDICVNHKTVQKLMKQLGLVCQVRAKRKYNSYKGEVGEVAPNLLERHFKTNQPNRKWVTDVTEFKVNDQKLYLSPILDLFNGEVVSYNLSRHPNFKQITDMLEGAFQKLPIKVDNLILHSDQGWQYQMKSYQNLLKAKGITQSMSRKATCLDNAVAENFFGLLKTELFYLEKFDSLFHIDASIKADTAYYYEKKKLWELRSNVHIRSQRGDKFDTDLLFWDEKQERVYSDKFIRIEQEDKIITGYGFESNQQMTEYQIYNNTGIFTVEDTAPADSTKAVANSTRTDSIR